MATDWPSLKDVRSELRLQPNADDDALIDQARAAAVDFGNRRTSSKWPPDDPSSWPAGGLPDVVFQAALFHAARLYRRRDSLDGTIGWGDMGLVRVGRVDPDIESLYAAVGPVVFG